MINEVFDDDAPDDTPEPEKPKGDLSRVFNGHEVWFHRPSTARTTALMRLRTSLAADFAKLKDQPASVETLHAMHDLSVEFDDTCLDFLEGLVVDPADFKVINRQLLRGELTVDQMLSAFFGGSEVDDDAEPVRKPRPVKRAANAKRTRR